MNTIARLRAALHHHDWDWAGDQWNIAYADDDDEVGVATHRIGWRCGSCGVTRIETAAVNDGTPAGAFVERRGRL